ncbi:heme/steroid binding domain containing protein [Plasmodium brasilianum]|uniref:Cytochrome b5 heme-binding domain-containing protein n=2 Tax=Plasmodium (Plasmodium) TaxID=418103 RepID=A0A1A8X2T8_PLAMA|nr:conserved protein, unknown function [Plasmodium malariae]KAI4835735.1 heme/steroid binding domain containing protein [Plasmodium brasilianum]SBS98918.1 hypothetical protein, conserved [Plasmodium malariae]SCP02667.1 conserved protein, unknown function [Plasmodium malariae]
MEQNEDSEEESEEAAAGTTTDVQCVRGEAIMDTCAQGKENDGSLLGKLNCINIEKDHVIDIESKIKKILENCENCKKYKKYQNYENSGKAEERGGKAEKTENIFEKENSNNLCTYEGISKNDFSLPIFFPSSKDDNNKNCNACNYCEDVCFSMICKKCKIKRKSLYRKYKKYKKHNLRICQNEMKLAMQLKKKAREILLSIRHQKMEEQMSKGDGGEGKERVDKTLTKGSKKTYHSTPQGNDKNYKHLILSTEEENTNNNINTKDDKYNALNALISRSKSTTNSEGENEKNFFTYYNYIKYKEYFTECEIKRHCQVNDCWVVANQNVYDVTTILNHHPGGNNCILNKAGRDVSVDYFYHSKYAQKKFWEPLKIGKVITCTKEIAEEKKKKKSLNSVIKNKCSLM